MPAATSLLVKLDVRRFEGSLSAVSEDVPGLHVRGDTADVVRQKAMSAIKALYWFNDKARVEVGLTADPTVLEVRHV